MPASFMRKKSRWPFLSIVLFATSCAMSPNIDWDRYLAQQGGQLKTYSPAEIDGLFTNQTSRYRTASHGNQIEYTAPNGRAYLWYPGNRRIVEGHWETKAGKLICFSYEFGAYNPATGEWSGRLDCSPIGEIVQDVVERCGGDIFELTSGLPGVLGKFEQITLPCH